MCGRFVNRANSFLTGINRMRPGNFSLGSFFHRKLDARGG